MATAGVVEVGCSWCLPSGPTPFCMVAPNVCPLDDGTGDPPRGPEECRGTRFSATYAAWRLYCKGVPRRDERDDETGGQEVLDVEGSCRRGSRALSHVPVV